MTENILQFLNLKFIENSIILQVFFVIFFTLILAVFAVRFLKKLKIKAAATESKWDDIIVQSLIVPVRLIIYIIGFSFALELLKDSLNLKILSAVSSIKDVLIVFVIMSFALRLIKNYEEGNNNSSLDANSINIISKLLRASVYITAVLILMQSFGINISGLLAFGGVGGLAIGFAAKDLLANFFGAIMIYMDKPFKVGDTIDSSDQNILGTIESIGWRLTVIRNFDQRPIYVPNSVFSSISVINISRMTHRRINEVIGIRYDDIKVAKKIANEIKEYIEKSDNFDHKQTTIVNLHQYADFSVNIKIYCFTYNITWAELHEVKQDLFLKVADIVEKNGADFAFPTQTLHVPEELKFKQA